jgi:hypothetical protein
MEHGTQGEPMPTFVKVLEVTFIFFYTVELIMKLAVHKRFFFCNENMY